MLDIEIRGARPCEMEGAATLAARAFRDNAMTIACWGRSSRRREQGLRVLFRHFLPTLTSVPLVAVQDATVVGVMGMAPPGTCRHVSLGPTLHLLTSMMLKSPAATHRFRQWMVQYEWHDPVEAHWHLGPVAVDPALQRRGIGSGLLARFCTAVDETRAVAYLETDEVSAVHLYERFGFKVVGRQRILGVDNWFMCRCRHP